MKHKKPKVLKGIRNITISGRIGTGKSTLANHLSESLGWRVLDGGKFFRKYADGMGFHITQKDKVPDKIDKAFEEKTKQILEKKSNYVMQTHLSGFLAQGIEGVYKILVVCEDEEGEDKQSIRIDRLMNRDFISSEDAKKEVHEREEKLLHKFKKLYVQDDPDWVYWDKKYYDLVINTFSLNQKEALKAVLQKLEI